MILKVKKKLCFVVVFVLLMLSFATQAVYAKHTAVGVSASSSYVKPKSNERIIICVGDSRVMQYTYLRKGKTLENFIFCFVNGGNVRVIDKKSGKLSKKLKSYLKKYKNQNPVVIFNMGVNGNGHPNGNAKRMIKIYNAWMKDYPTVDFYVQSVGPTSKSRGSYSNSNVIAVNKVLEKEYKPKGIWIDTYDYLKSKNIVTSRGKGLRDGLHYKNATSKKILEYLRNFVEKKAVAKLEGKLIRSDKK